MLEVGGEQRNLTVHVAPVRKPLLAVCDLNARGHNVHFMASGHAWAEHAETGQVTPFVKSGGKYEMVATVLHPRWRGADP